VSNKPFRLIQLASLALLPATACSSMSNFTWFGLKKPKPAATAADNAPAAAPNPNDPVNQRVNDYVKGFEPDDFNSKIARQSAPSRAKPARIVHMEQAPQDPVPDAPAAMPSLPPVSPDEPVEITLADNAAAPSSPKLSNPPAAMPAPGSAAARQPPADDHHSEINASAVNDTEPQPPASTPQSTPTAAPMAPRLKVVSIAEVGAPPKPAAPAPSNSTPVANQSASTRSDPSIDAMIRDLESSVVASPNDVDQQVRLRMLYAAIGADDKAIAPTPGMNADVQQLVSGLMKTLLEARSSGGRDPAASATKQLAAMEQLRSSLKSRADLAIPVLAICNRIEDYGRYQTIDPPDFPGGVAGKALLYVELANFKSDKLPSGEYRTLLSMRTSLLTPDGAEVWSEVDDNIQDVASRPRAEFYLMKPLFLAATLVPGEYVVKTEVEDKLGAKTNSKTTRLRILSAAARREPLGAAAARP